MAPLSLIEQDRLIRRGWPFRTIVLGGDFGLWSGEVVGFSKRYEISILYVRRHFQDGFEYAHAWFPEVRVRSPLIVRREGEPETPIPHVYGEGVDPKPMLCLFDPAAQGWSPSQSIADTTIPLAADWLRYYEAWQATGIWTGGGRDHATRDSAPSPARTSNGLRTAQVARVSGMHVSRAILTTREARLAGSVSRLQFGDCFARLPFVLRSNEGADAGSEWRLAA
jgi:hypothetical protein